MPVYEALLKQVDPLLVASIRERIPIISERGQLYETLSAYLEQHGVQSSQPDVLLLHSRHEIHDNEMSIDVESAIALPTALPGNERIHIRTLPAGLMACTIHAMISPSVEPLWPSTGGWQTTATDSIRRPDWFISNGQRR